MKPRTWVPNETMKTNHQQQVSVLGSSYVHNCLFTQTFLLLNGCLYWCIIMRISVMKVNMARHTLQPTWFINVMFILHEIYKRVIISEQFDFLYISIYS